MPPFIAEVITSTSAMKRPMETVLKIMMREKAISAQADIIITDTLCRSSAVSVSHRPPESASRKKYVPPNARFTSRNISAAAGSCPGDMEKLPRKPVSPMTSPAAVGMKKLLLYTSSSWNTKDTVYTSTAAAIYRIPHSSPPPRRYPSAAPVSANTPLIPGPEQATIAMPNGAPSPSTREQDITPPRSIYIPQRAAIRRRTSAPPPAAFRAESLP